MKTISVISFILLLCTAAITPVIAAPFPIDEIDFPLLDSAITAQMTKHGLPGAALAVIQDGEIIYQKGYGTEGRNSMTTQTKMFIGSQSKSFTALMIAQLEEKGLIDLNNPVQTYIPWFRVADEKASEEISLNHLLHHTSGLSEAGYGIVLPPETALEVAVRSLSQAELTAPVGMEFQYFNMGYDVLAYIIEVVIGKSYAEILQEQVLEPLRMTHTTADPIAMKDVSQGYSRLFGFAMPRKQIVRKYEIGAGYIVSTAEDMALYAIAMMNDGAGLIKPETARQIFTPGLGDYGLGWHITRDGEKIYHGGANETFHTEVNIYPQRDIAFVLLINEGHLVDHFTSTAQLTNTVESIVLGYPPQSVSQGWSVRWMGWGLGILVLALLVLHTRNFYTLFKQGKKHFHEQSISKRILAAGISILLPTIILIIVFSQMQDFFGNRFNLLTNLAQFSKSLPDIFILMLIGILPDYIQGFIKLIWIVTHSKVPLPASTD